MTTTAGTQPENLRARMVAAALAWLLAELNGCRGVGRSDQLPLVRSLAFLLLGSL